MFILEELGQRMGCICDKGQNGGTFELEGRRFKIVRKLADGGFSTVHLVRDVTPKSWAKRGEYFALKKMLCHSLAEIARAKLEIEIHLKYGLPVCENILPLVAWRIGNDNNNNNNNNNNNANNSQLDTQIVYNITKDRVEEPTPVYIVLPYFRNGTLLEELNRRRSTDDYMVQSRVLRLFMGICQAVQVLHANGLAHRDLKTGNVLLSEDDVPYLIDFGSVRKARISNLNLNLVRTLTDDSAEFCSMAYRPPELFSPEIGADLDERTDIWSLGCVLYALCFFCSPFDQAIERGDSVALAVQSANIRIPAESPYSLAIHTLIRQLIEVDLAKRPFIDKVISIVKSLQ